MKTKIFISSALFVAVLFGATALGVGEASAATGDLKDIFPPGNKGTSQGVGMIDGHDGNKYVFQTPLDNGGQELKEGDEVFFETGNGRKVSGVTQETSSPIGEAGNSVDSETELQEGKKGLNAVDVKITHAGSVIDIPSTGSKMGDPIPDIDITIDQSTRGREMVMPGDNVLCIDGAKIVIDRDSGRSTGHDDDCDGIPEERGDKVIQIIKGNRNTGHINVLRFRTIGDIIERVQETLVGCELDVCAQVRENADARHGLIEEASQFARDGDLDEVGRIIRIVQSIVAGDIERIERALERELSDDDRKKLSRTLRLEKQLDRRIEGLLQVLEKAKSLDAFVSARATDPTDSDGDGYGDARSYPIREGGHTVKPGQRQELSDSPIVIELPMSKGTVKFFNETKSIDVTINTPTKTVRVVREIKK